MALLSKNPFSPFGGPRLSQKDFESLGREQGYRVKWEKAMYCPRRINNDFDKHDMNCPVCESRFGIIYFDPKVTDPYGQDLRAIVTGIPQEQQYRAEGYTDAGSAYVSLPPKMTPNYGDRIWLLESRMRVSQVLKRGPTDIDKLKYKAIPASQNGGILYVVDGNGVNHTGNVVLTPGSGQQDGCDLQWVQNAPPEGATFSVMYYRTPAYIIVDLPHIIRDNLREGDDVNEDLGTQALCKLDFLIRDESLGG
jgi:hypothetical protein